MSSAFVMEQQHALKKAQDLEHLAAVSLAV